MRIQGIDFPEEIIEALSHDRLVIFAGAGTAIDAPAHLPSFKKMTLRIAEESHVAFDPKTMSPDVFLGDLERNGVNVKDILTRSFKNTKSSCNELQRIIVGLFSNKHAVRIVTTNYDLLLEEAYQKIWHEKPKSYSYPALPFGNDFSGIVHLHGTLEEPKNMIVTDNDFGNAYMLNGFAARFLVSMFEEYKVLFIGYSYHDLVVRYLTSSIPPAKISGAYILNDATSRPMAMRARLKHISYPEDRHDLMRSALGELGRFLKIDANDWKNIIDHLDPQRPPLEESMRDEILEKITYDNKNRRYVAKLCEHIDGMEWLTFLDDHQIFDRLFMNVPLNEADQTWGHWLVKHFISNELLSLIIHHHQKVNREFVSRIFFAIASDDPYISNECFGMYWSLLKDLIDDENLYVLLCENALGREMYTLLFDIFTHSMKCSYILKKHETYEINFAFETPYVFNEIWKNHVYPHLDHYLFEAFDFGVATLKSLGDHVTCYDQGDLSMTYEKMEKDDRLVSLFEMINQVFTRIMKKDEAYGEAWINEHLHGSLVITNLSLMFLRKYARRSADEKLMLAMDEEDLYDLGTFKQLYLLFSDCYFAASDQVKARLRQLLKAKNNDITQSYLALMDEKEPVKLISFEHKQPQRREKDVPDQEDPLELSLLKEEIGKGNILKTVHLIERALSHLDSINMSANFIEEVMKVETKLWQMHKLSSSEKPIIRSVMTLFKESQGTSLPVWLKDFVNMVLKTPSENVVSLLLSETYDFFSLDEKWTKQTLLVYLLDEKMKKAAWKGLLKGENTTLSLNRCLYSYYQNSFSVLKTLDEESHMKFVDRYTFMTIELKKDPHEDLLLLIRNRKNSLEAMQMAKSIRHYLTILNMKMRDAMWRGWLKNYWQERNEGNPPIYREEASEMLRWLPLLGSHFSEGVALLIDGEVENINTKVFLHQFENTYTKYKSSSIRLLKYLLEHGKKDLYSYHVMKEMIESLKEDLTDADQKQFTILFDDYMITLRNS